MAEIGAGTGTGYPAALDTDTSVEINNPLSGRTKARAEVINDLSAAVVAIETELGTAPSGTKTDVKTYLQTEHETDGTHGGITLPYAAKTTAYTATATDEIISVSGTTTITLPTAIGITGKAYTIVRTDASLVTSIVTTASQTISGRTTIDIMSQYGFIKIISDNANWLIVGISGIIR
mgnify:CR=1 FL=1